MGDLKNTVLTKEQVLNDPYGYTYNEILQVLGENTSKSLMADLYRKKAQIAITSWTPRGKNLGHGWSRRIYP